MTRENFARIMAWTPEDEQLAQTGHAAAAAVAQRNRPAPWPVVMTVQRIAFQRGLLPAAAAACSLTEH